MEKGLKQWIDKLRKERTLRPEEFRQLLTECDAETLRTINRQAREVSLRHFGNKIYIRGLIEVSNCCRNNCYYCGIRKGNPTIERYRLTEESILDCCKQGYDLGLWTDNSTTTMSIGTSRNTRTPASCAWTAT